MNIPTSRPRLCHVGERQITADPAEHSLTHSLEINRFMSYFGVYDTGRNFVTVAIYTFIFRDVVFVRLGNSGGCKYLGYKETWLCGFYCGHNICPVEGCMNRVVASRVDLEVTSQHVTTVIKCNLCWFCIAASIVCKGKHNR